MTKIERATPRAALATLRDHGPMEGYKPLLTLGHPKDCDIVRNAAATLILIAEFLTTDAGEEFNHDILRHVIKGVADSLFLRDFAEEAT